MLGEQLQIESGSILDPSLSLPSGLDLLSNGTLRDKRQSQQRSLANIPVRLRPGSTSQRWSHELTGRIKNYSTTGCGIILDRPPYVGDIYRFHQANNVESPFTECLARCIRCHLIDEEVFEAGFQFLTPLPIESVSDGLL